MKLGRQICNEQEGKIDGVLTHKAEEYLRCLDLGHRRLEDLLIADLKHWTDGLVVARNKAEKLKKHLSTLLARQFLELTEFLDTGRLKPRFDLKRLPIWGLQADSSEINFEWPTTRDLDLMSPDVSLKAIQFKTSASSAAIASVVCVLSNEQHSPLFE